MTVEVEAASQAELFRAIADLGEVFGETACGLCECEQLRYNVRTIEENDYYEVCCCNPECGAKLAFGQMKKPKGRLFPIRKLTKEGKPSRAEGSYGPHKGWSRFRGKFVPEDSAE